MQEKKENATPFQTLEGLRHVEGLKEATKITIVYRLKKVSASCKIGRYNYSGTGATKTEALTAMESNVLTRKN